MFMLGNKVSTLLTLYYDESLKDLILKVGNNNAGAKENEMKL